MTADGERYSAKDARPSAGPASMSPAVALGPFAAAARKASENSATPGHRSDGSGRSARSSTGSRPLGTAAGGRWKWGPNCPSAKVARRSASVVTGA